MFYKAVYNASNFKKLAELVLRFRETPPSGEKAILPPEASFHPEPPQPTLATLNGPGKRLREEADDYPHVITELNDDWRVIRCKDGLQLVLQKRGGMSDGQRRWRGKGYFRRRDSLLRYIREDVGPVEPQRLAIIAALPPLI